MKSLAVCTFFGSGANRLQEEPDFEEAALLVELDEFVLLFVERQPAVNKRTAQHITSRAEQR
jgi:hypothetical protein